MNEHINEQHVCKSCGNRFSGSYCNVCGEKVLTGADRAFKTFLNSILVAVTFADSAFLRTLKEVLIRPGNFSKSFIEGKRVKFVRPISLFLVLNIFYFFFPLIQLFNASLNTQLLTPFAPLYKDIIATKMVNMELDIENFSLVYNIKTRTLAKMMVMVFVFFSSLPLNLIFIKRNRFFTDHIDFMTEVASFNLFANALVLTVLVSLLGLGQYLNELSLTVIFIITNLYFLLRGIHTFYETNGWRLVVRSILVIIGMKIGLEIYRALLFFLTILLL